MSLKRLKDFVLRGDNLPRVVVIVALAISGLPLLAVAMYRDANDAETKVNQNNLEQEFRAIKHLPQAKELNYASSQKSGRAYIEASYETDLAIGEADSYYDHQLATHGGYSTKMSKVSAFIVSVSIKRHLSVASTIISLDVRLCSSGDLNR
jgi:hypothetical protein